MTGDAERYRRRLHDLMTADLPFEERQRRVLELGCEYLGVETAFVSRIDVPTNEFVVVASTADADSTLATGTTHDLSETYCRHTIDADAPLAMHDVGTEPGWDEDPAYEKHGLDCYLGATVTVGGELYGTVCFVSPEPRATPFSEAETLFADLVARLLGSAIERRRHEAELADRDARLDARERELEETERKYETLLEAAPDAIFIAEVDTGEIVEANEAATTLTGYSREALVGMSVEAFYPDGEKERYAGVYEELLDTHGTVSQLPDGEQLRMVDRTGEPFPVEVSVSVVEVDGEQLFQGIVRDVTNRHDRLQRLRRSEERARSLVEASFDVAFRVDFDGIVREVSEPITELLGYRPEALVGEHFSTVMPDSVDISDSMTALRQVLDGETVELPYVRFETADGEVRYMDLRAAPIYDGSEAEDGSLEREEIVGIQGMARDVTERYERERELRVRTRAIETADFGIVITDPTTEHNPIIYANEHFEELTGYDEATLKGRNCRLLQGTGTATEPAEQLREAVEEGESTSVELVNYRADGTPFWNHISITPVTDAEGTITHFVGFQRDVTDRKRRERLLKVLNRVLRHNLRNSMNVVQGFAANLETELTARGEETLADRADVVRSTADELLSVSETARALEDVVRRSESPETVDVVPFVRRTVRRAESTYPDAEVRVDLPERADAVAAGSLESALWELLDNAIRYSDGHVEVGIERADGRVVVFVRDDGPGLPEQDEAVLCEGRETPLEHGSGLGLWLVNWVTTGLGGRVETGDVDGGTRVELRLMASTAAAEEGRAAPASALHVDHRGDPASD